MTTTSIEQLEREIERLVREHVAACRRAAAAAVQRAFSAVAPAPPRASARKRSRATGERREPAQIAALGERLYEAVVARPGGTMTELAPDVGATPRELHRPMTRLRRAGRVRSVGQRHQTRYFPMAATAEG